MLLQDVQPPHEAAGLSGINMTGASKSTQVAETAHRGVAVNTDRVDSASGSAALGCEEDQGQVQLSALGQLPAGSSSS